jgi:nucleotide-binding universal stress UspA family protein
MYRSLMVPLDGSAFGEYALPHALGIAQRAGARVELIHICTPPLPSVFADGLVNPHLVEPPLELAGEQARAYLDQLARTHAIKPERAAAIKTALERADKARNAKDKGGAAAAEQLKALAAQVAEDASGATGRDAMRLKALAETLSGRSAGPQ